MSEGYRDLPRGGGYAQPGPAGTTDWDDYGARAAPLPPLEEEQPKRGWLRRHWRWRYLKWTGYAAFAAFVLLLCWLLLFVPVSRTAKPLVPPQIVLETSETLRDEDRAHLDEIFLSNVFPVLSPLAIDPAHPFPFIANMGYCLAITLERKKDRRSRNALLPIPHQVARFMALPAPDGQNRFIYLEHVLLLHIESLFPGYRIKDHFGFRVLRDSDLEVEEEAEDLVREFEVALKRRRRGEVVRLTHSAGAPEKLKSVIMAELGVKERDVIEIDGTYGWINSLRARYASVITRDGKEHLIPNEDLITSKVVNWSFSDKNVRVRVPIDISYESDPRQAILLCLEAARAAPRVLNDPEPRCLLRGFGEHSVKLQLRFWIEDPSNGVGNVRSEVLLAIWDQFQKAGVEIPFPQQDIHVRSMPKEFLETKTS